MKMISARSTLVHVSSMESENSCIESENSSIESENSIIEPENSNRVTKFEYHV